MAHSRSSWRQRVVQCVFPRESARKSFESSYINTGDSHRSNQVDNTFDSQRSTDGLGQFVTVSVHRCVQLDERQRTRRAGPSATAVSCFYFLRRLSCFVVSCARLNYWQSVLERALICRIVS